VYVEESVHDEFVAKLKALAAKRRLGPPLSKDTKQGPQIDQAQFDKIMSYIQKGKADGANCVMGGNRFGDRGYYIEPTIFDNVTDKMAIAQDEIFGPVMSVLKFRDWEDLIARANNTFYGLAAAIWTKDLTKAHDFARRVRAGTVWVNCYDVFDAAAPFGGFKMSGQGRELGEDGLRAYTETKTVTINLG
jgi:aldehyde dehydrogenase (NAD+)